MRIDEFKNARRSDEEWEPFMRGLERRIRVERKFRWAPIAAAAALALVLLGLAWLLPRRQTVPPLRAEVPSASAPVFTPASGAAFQTQGGVLVMTVEERS
jgi:hypothetical protein